MAGHCADGGEANKARLPIEQIAASATAAARPLRNWPGIDQNGPMKPYNPEARLTRVKCKPEELLPFQRSKTRWLLQ
jgi:hypothetical protein